LPSPRPGATAGRAAGTTGEDARRCHAGACPAPRVSGPAADPTTLLTSFHGRAFMRWYHRTIVFACALLLLGLVATAPADDKKKDDEKTEPDVIFVPTPQEVVD